MYKIKINQQQVLETEIQGSDIYVDGKVQDIDMIPIGENRFHIILDHKSFLAELVDFEATQKIMVIKVNNHIYHLEAKDQYDELLKNLGLDNLNASQLKEIKAPMPGLVLKVLAKEGSELKKGDNLLVLEAMKMENMMKAPADMTIKKINVKPGDKVDKNQVMVVLG